MYGTKLFYSESDDAVTAFYVYDFENKTRDEIFDMPKFMLRGRSYTFIEDIVYFYLGVDTGKNIKNVLYAMDFSEQKMFPVNENIYAQKLIPLINVNEQLFALQGDRDESGNVKFWIEKNNENGTIENVNISQNVTTVLNLEDKMMSHRIAYFDADERYFYTIEVVTTDLGNEYYFVRYDTDLNFVDATTITDILKNTEVGEGICTADEDMVYFLDVNCG